MLHHFPPFPSMTHIQTSIPAKTVFDYCVMKVSCQYIEKPTTTHGTSRNLVGVTNHSDPRRRQTSSKSVKSVKSECIPAAPACSQKSKSHSLQRQSLKIVILFSIHFNMNRWSLRNLRTIRLHMFDQLSFDILIAIARRMPLSVDGNSNISSSRSNSSINSTYANFRWHRSHPATSQNDGM